MSITRKLAHKAETVKGRACHGRRTRPGKNDSVQRPSSIRSPVQRLPGPPPVRDHDSHTGFGSQSPGTHISALTAPPAQTLRLTVFVRQ
jgi:hypothetical protein